MITARELSKAWNFDMKESILPVASHPQIGLPLHSEATTSPPLRIP